MINKVLVTLVMMFVLISISYSQEKGEVITGSISGKIYDLKQNIPIEYANIVLFNQNDSVQITGTTSNPQGKFKLDQISPGQYFLEIYFIGYFTRRIEHVVLSQAELKVDLGTITLEQTVLPGEAVVVEGEQAAITYRIDKKVINVGKQYTAISGTAVEVLENVPSISVDIEGNVSLRGSGNFRLLIDGRPILLDPNDALQQIPASTIENIEIITNPSAKYDPEGTAGIINVILKKSKSTGRSGLANMNIGLKDKFSGDILGEYKDNRYNLILAINYNKRFFSGTSKSENITTQEGLTSNIYSNGDSRNGRTSTGIRSELAITLSPQDVFSLAGRYDDGIHEDKSALMYDQWTYPMSQYYNYTSNSIGQHSEKEYSGNMQYQHRFTKSGHEISGELSLDYENGEDESIDELIDENNVIISGRKSTEGGPSNEFRSKIDYSLPLGQENKFEAGYQSELESSQENNTLFDYYPESGDYQFMPEYSNSTNYRQDIHALYTIYSGKWQRFGYQGGIRSEYTYRKIEMAGNIARFTLDRWDYFPTFHLSYQLQKGQQMMASYTRRIDRPHGYYLEPFLTWMDAYNVRSGNPALKPEYIDSYELGFQTYFSKNLFSAEAYYRTTHNKVENIQSVYDDNITLHTIENVGKDYSFGSELLLNLDLIKNWNLNLMGNFYNYRIEGILDNRMYSRESFNWSTRINNTIKLGSSTLIQINGIYNSPTISSQGRREGFFVTNMAIKYEILQNRLSAILQLRDVFNTGRYEYTTAGFNFYSYNYHSHEAPIVMLNIRYNINNYKVKVEENGDRDGTEGTEDF